MDSSSISCPFCNLTVPLNQIQRHANSHFEEEDKYDEQLTNPIALRISFLTGSQIKSNFYHVKDGLMLLLSKCLEQKQEPGPGNAISTTYLSGYVDHFQSVVSEDVGWGCGWRNIQMLSSHLLSSKQDDVKHCLFGGSGFVPDIPSLQQWLELAWERGFDAVGSTHFGKSIYGSRSWIGTTECAALFRSFGLRARIVDFSAKELESLLLSVPNTMKTNTHGKRKVFEVHGPMDRYIFGRNPDGFSSQNGTCADASDQFLGIKSERHQVLMDWVWNYFSDKTSIIHGDRPVIISNRSPLYFQHDGHSRTIVGIQVKIQQNGLQEYNLLILDPAHKTGALERSLRENKGWKKLLKRGVHTLKKPQYQLCYIDPGIASGEEMEQLKTMDSVLVTF